jgi:hypothetical protein
MKNPYMRDARPWDLFNKNLGRVDDELAQERLEICKVCPELIKTTSQCKKCGCIMNLKTKHIIKHSSNILYGILLIICIALKISSKTDK